MATLLKWLVAAVAWVVAVPAPAQEYPARPIRLVVPFPPGGTLDGVVRMLQPELARSLGQPVVVENKAGAAGRIGTQDVARSAADGYTLLAVFDTFAVDPIVFGNLPYDPWKDLVPVSLLVRSPLVAVASRKLPVNDLRELVAHTKANPGKVTYGSLGPASSNHLTTELFTQITGASMVHVPYKGGAPAMTDLMGNHLDFMWVTGAFANQVMKSGNVKLLGQGGARRGPAFPDLPTAAEQGIRGFEVYGWFGLMAPAGTPPAVVERWRVELQKAASLPQMAEWFRGQGYEVVMSGGAEFADFLRAENAKWADLIKRTGISVQQ